MSIIQTLISFVGFVADFVILIFCISYMSKMRTTDSILLFIGGLIHVIMRLFYVAIPYLSIIRDSGTDGLMGFYTIGNFFSLIGSVLFCIGIVMLIRRVLSMQPRSHR